MVVERKFTMVLQNGYMNVRYFRLKKTWQKENLFIFLDEIFNENVLLFWSPTDRYLAFIKINLTNVPKNHYLKYDFTLENDDQYSIPYPKYNDPIPLLDVYIFNTRSKKTIRVSRPIEYNNL